MQVQDNVQVLGDETAMTLLLMHTLGLAIPANANAPHHVSSHTVPSARMVSEVRRDAAIF